MTGGSTGIGSAARAVPARPAGKDQDQRGDDPEADGQLRWARTPWQAPHRTGRRRLRTLRSRMDRAVSGPGRPGADHGHWSGRRCDLRLGLIGDPSVETRAGSQGDGLDDLGVARCSGTGCRRWPRGWRPRRGRRRRRGRRARPSACPACRCRTGRRRPRGTRAGAASRAHRAPAPRALDGRDVAPSTWQTGTRHESTGAPSSRTVHAPHSPSPQPSFVPVRREVLAQHVEQPAHARDVDLDGRRR